MAKVTWKLAEGQTWRRKLTQRHPNHGKVLPVPKRMQRRFGSGTMVIPRPLDIDAIIRRVRRGKLITYSEIRNRLAQAANTDSACPMTTGIFVRIVAEAAEEDRRNGKKRITPYWRAIRDNGELNDGYPGGAEAQARHLRDEGIAVGTRARSGRLRVLGFDATAARAGS